MKNFFWKRLKCLKTINNWKTTILQKMKKVYHGKTKCSQSKHIALIVRIMGKLEIENYVLNLTLLIILLSLV